MALYKCFYDTLTLFQAACFWPLHFCMVGMPCHSMCYGWLLAPLRILGMLS